MLNAIYEVFHTDTGNELRNRSYEGIKQSMAWLPRLDSPTIYLNTAPKAEKFLRTYPDFKINTVHDYAQPGETFPPSSGVIGVWASNYLAYKNFLETDKDMLFIFEDDVVLSTNFRPVIEQYLQELPADWDFFSFFVPDDSLFAYNKEWHEYGAQNLCRSYQQWSCAGYIASRQGAEKAIADVESRGATAPIDWYIFNFRMKQEPDQMRFNTYTVKPNAYRPIKFLMEAATQSQIHWGSTEALHTA